MKQITQILFKMRSEQDNFPDFYERLAWALEGQGTVYTPHPLIPPYARMAKPIPTEIVVALDSTGAFEAIRSSMLDHIQLFEDAELTFEKDDRTITVNRDEILKMDSFVDHLMPAIDGDDS
jgi:hypothetical protein